MRMMLVMMLSPECLCLSACAGTASLCPDICRVPTTQRIATLPSEIIAPGSVSLLRPDSANDTYTTIRYTSACAAV